MRSRRRRSANRGMQHRCRRGQSAAGCAGRCIQCPQRCQRQRGDQQYRCERGQGPGGNSVAMGPYGQNEGRHEYRMRPYILIPENAWFSLSTVMSLDSRMQSLPPTQTPRATRSIRQVNLNMASSISVQRQCTGCARFLLICRVRSRANIAQKLFRQAQYQPISL